MISLVNISSPWQIFKLKKYQLIFISFCCVLLYFKFESPFKQRIVYINVCPGNLQNPSKNISDNVTKQLNTTVRTSLLVNGTGSAYLVNTTNCRILRWPVLDAEVRQLFENRTNDTIRCPVTQHNITIERHDFNGIKVTNPLNKDVTCFARALRRKDKMDNEIEFSWISELDITQVEYFPNDIAVQVNCTIAEDNNTYSKVIPLIPELKSKHRFANQKVPNVLLLGIDSVSRLNFERHFALTKEFIRKKAFHTMYGYNKVGDNTFPNLIPLLTGFYAEDIWDDSSDSPFDYFPIIWDDFKRKGFLTYYMEDIAWMNIFNYCKKGFQDQPTDYYLRPFFRAIDPIRKDNCYLDKPEMEVYYEYLYDFIKAKSRINQRYFALHFMVGLTHDFFNSAGLMDPFVANLFKRLFEEQLIADTVIIFFADHGMRFGSIRETMSGKYEERLPFMHIYVPEKWRNKNLTTNQNRLTSPFDIHATLKHLVRGKPDRSLRYGKTLFEEIPEDRSCQSIPISDHWCACQASEPIPNLDAVRPMAEFIVNETNRLLEPVSEKCAKLTLDTTQSAAEQRMNDKALRFDGCKREDLCSENAKYSNESFVSQTKNFLITVRVRPSGALLEATLNYDIKEEKMSLIGDISRINSYGNQSLCIENAFLRKYCFCK